MYALYCIHYTYHFIQNFTLKTDPFCYIFLDILQSYAFTLKEENRKKIACQVTLNHNIILDRFVFDAVHFNHYFEPIFFLISIRIIFIRTLIAEIIKTDKNTSLE